MILEEHQLQYGVPITLDVRNIHNLILGEVKGGGGCDIPPGLTATVGVRRDVNDNDNFAIFKQQILDFRQWMKEHSQQDKELIITEFGILMPEELGFPEGRVTDFMHKTFDYLTTAADPDLGYPDDCYRLVQRWAWFSLNCPKKHWVCDPPPCHWTEGFNGSLFDPDTKAITGLGISYSIYPLRMIYLPQVVKAPG